MSKRAWFPSIRVYMRHQGDKQRRNLGRLLSKPCENVFARPGMQQIERAHTLWSCVCTALQGPASIHPVGFSRTDRSLDAAPRREDGRAKEGPCLTAPGNDSLQMLCRVTSANHNNPFKTPKKMWYKEQGHGLFFFFFPAHIMRPRDKHLHREEEREKRLLEVQLCFMQMNQ